MRKVLVRVIAIYFLVYGAYPILKDVVDIFAHTRLPDVRSVIFWLLLFMWPMMLLQWLWPLVLHYTGCQMILFREEGRNWGLGLSVIYIVLITIQIIESLITKDTSFLFLDAGIYDLYFVLMLIFFRKKEIRDLFSPGNRSDHFVQPTYTA